MPFCPKCRYEYVPGIVECPDCDVKLVEKLPEKAHDAGLVTVASFRFPIEAETAKLKLESRGITAIVLGDQTWTNVGIDVSAIEGGVRLRVREDDAPRATQILAEEQANDR